MIKDRNKEIEISVFKNKRDVIQNVSFKKIINSIKNGDFNATIHLLRENKAKGRLEWKEQKNYLPGFTVSGKFDKVRQKQNILVYTGIIGIDFDDVNINIETENPIINAVNSDAHTLASFISPSGNGFKIFARASSGLDLHDTAYRLVTDYYQNLTNWHADTSGKDYSRLCYVSSDPNAYYNENAEVIPVTEEAKEAVELKNKERQLSQMGHLAGSTQFEKVVDLTAHVHDFVEGNRNEFVNLLANNCNRWGISIDDAITNILNSEYCYDRKEVVSTIYSAYKNTHQHNKYPTQKLNQNVAGVASVAQQVIATNSRFRSFKQLAEEGKYLKPLKKLFGNYILEKSTTLFPSERGVGKSFLAMQIAIKIAEGAKEFLGEDLEVHGNVLYVNLELGDHTIKKRMEKLLENQSSDGEFQAYSFDERGGFFGSISLIREFCNDKKPVLIIIDNLRTAIAGADNENNKVMTSIVTEINKLKDEFNCSFLIVHHTKKGSGNQMTNSDMQSGAGSLSDLVDADFFLRKSGVDKNYRVLKRIKARECEEQDGAKLIALNPETLWFEFVEEDIDESTHVLYEKSAVFREKREDKIIQLIKKGLSDSDISKELSIDRSTAFRARRKLSQI